MTTTTWIVLGLVIAFAIVLCFCLAIASFSVDNFYESLKENNKRQNSSGISTYEYVENINEKVFEGKLNIVKCAENQDHYSAGVVALSEKTMISNSLASLATVSHELGHAYQDKISNKLRKQWRLRRIGKMFGFLFLPLVLAGSVLSLLSIFNILVGQLYFILGLTFLGLGVLIFFFAIFIKYKEIQIEKEASVYAMIYLEQILSDIELKHCQEFLKSARLTYWASLFRTLLGWTLLTKKDSMF